MAVEAAVHRMDLVDRDRQHVLEEVAELLLTTLS
jgi:hypothetical protein